MHFRSAAAAPRWFFVLTGALPLLAAGSEGADPPPPGVLRQQIAARVRGLSLAQRRAALANLARVQAYAKAIATQLKKYDVGKRAR